MLTFCLFFAVLLKTRKTDSTDYLSRHKIGVGKTRTPFSRNTYASSENTYAFW